MASTATLPVAANDEAVEEEAPKRRKWLIWLLVAFLIFLLIVGAGILYLWTLPFPNPHPNLQATLIYDANGKVVGEFSEQNRVDVPLSQVPPVVINAVVSTEDRHFFSEGAINPVSMGRALFTDISGGGLQGGSTITQQYVKQAYLTPKRTLVRKIEEAALAIRLSQKQSKKQILDEYLNTIYWGRGAYGVEAASLAYFGEGVNKLGLPQASLLAGLIREPDAADPAINPELARRNQDDTLKAMVRDKKITKAQALAVERMPFSAYVRAPTGSSSGAKPQSADDFFLAAVRQQLYNRFGRQMVDSGGLRVTTTLNSTLESQAYNEVYGNGPNALNPADGDPSGAVVSLDDNGHVVALVGGQNYSKSSVDLALGRAGGGSGRQAGSTFKAYMLAYLIKAGYSVQSVFPAPSQFVLPHGNTGGAPWVVTNYEHESVNSQMSIIDATALSVNTVYAQLVNRLGANNLDAMAEALGISKSELGHPYPSQVLGSADVSPLEMAAAYATFADGGVYHAPVFITRVTRSNGSPLSWPAPPRPRRVLTQQQAAVETYVLQQVVARGTGVAAGNVGSPVAGKTGTTENAGDGWFIGYTPNLTTSLWMGYADSERSMDGFRGIANVAGGTIPAELWHDYMAAALAAFPQLGGNFPAPSLGGKILTPTAASPSTSTSSSSSTTTTTAKPAKPTPTTVLSPPTTKVKGPPPPTATTTTSSSTTSSTTTAPAQSPNST